MTDGPSSAGVERFADDARRYRLDSRIATGGMGEVWRGTDTTLGREVAIKLLKPEYADDPTFRTRFETEAQHAASLHHPNVAGVYDFGESRPSDGSGTPRPYLVMELVNGQPLSVLLRRGEPLDPVAVRELLSQAADAIGAAHAAGIVHRDVKPANLMVTPDRQVKITDFGIARAAEGLGLTETGQVMGTPQYLSPEQARGQAATPASDVYSLGVVAFECLAGHRPFQAETAVATALAHLNEPVPDLPGSVPADLAAVVRHALEKSPNDRFPDAAAFGAALRDPATAATALTGGAAAGADAGEATQVMRGVPPLAGAAAGFGAAGAASAVDDPSPTPSEPLAPTPGARSSSGGGRLLLLVGLIIAALIAAVLLIVVLGNSADQVPPPDNPTKRSTRDKPNKPDRTSDKPTEESSAPTQESSAPTQESSPSQDSPSQTPSSSAPTSQSPSASESTSAPTSPPTSQPPSETPSESTPPASAPASGTDPSASASPAGAADPESAPPTTAPGRSTTQDAPAPTAQGQQR